MLSESFQTATPDRHQPSVNLGDAQLRHWAPWNAQQRLRSLPCCTGSNGLCRERTGHQKLLDEIGHSIVDEIGKNFRRKKHRMKKTRNRGSQTDGGKSWRCWRNTVRSSSSGGISHDRHRHRRRRRCHRCHRHYSTGTIEGRLLQYERLA